MARFAWIDLVRGCSMAAILLFHTEIYFAGSELIPYNLYVENVLVAFFFCSGFLFTRPGRPLSLRKKLTQVVRRLCLPYFFFTLLIAFPKAAIHGRSTNAASVLLHIVAGKASWFVAALIVSEVILALLVRGLRHRRLSLLAVCTVLSLLAWCFGNTCRPQWLLLEEDYWCLHEALLVMPFLALGLLLRHHYRLLSEAPAARLLVCAAVLCMALVALKVFVVSAGSSEIICPLKVSSWPLFMADNLLSTALLVIAAQLIERRVHPQLPPTCQQRQAPGLHLSPTSFLRRALSHCVGAMEWTGRHSLVIYFFCGGIPLLTSLVLHRAGFAYAGQYWRVLAAFMAVCALSAATAWFFHRYFAFILGEKKKE